jgi:hypothetical protein
MAFLVGRLDSYYSMAYFKYVVLNSYLNLKKEKLFYTLR